MIFATYRKRLKYLLIEVLGYPKQALPPFKVANEEVAAGKRRNLFHLSIMAILPLSCKFYRA